MSAMPARRFTSRAPAQVETAVERRTTRALARLHGQTIVRIAAVQAEGLVQGAKLREVDYLAREAMSGQALLCKWRDTLAAGDPMLGDELRFFTDIARIGKGEVIADAIDTYCRESRS